MERVKVELVDDITAAINESLDHVDPFRVGEDVRLMETEEVDEEREEEMRKCLHTIENGRRSDDRYCVALHVDRTLSTSHSSTSTQNH